VRLNSAIAVLLSEGDLTYLPALESLHSLDGGLGAREQIAPESDILCYLNLTAADPPVKPRGVDPDQPGHLADGLARGALARPGLPRAGKGGWRAGEFRDARGGEGRAAAGGDPPPVGARGAPRAFPPPAEARGDPRDDRPPPPRKAEGRPRPGERRLAAQPAA